MHVQPAAELDVPPRQLFAVEEVLDDVRERSDEEREQRRERDLKLELWLTAAQPQRLEPAFRAHRAPNCRRQGASLVRSPRAAP